MSRAASGLFLGTPFPVLVSGRGGRNPGNKIQMQYIECREMGTECEGKTLIRDSEWVSMMWTWGSVLE